jgi:exosortase D (VPLPA-CTERM-specific)
MHTTIKRALWLAPVAASFAILYHDVVAKLVHDWATDDNYSHGFLIVPIALYFVWERRARLAAAVVRPSLLGVLLVVASVLVLGAGVLGAELFLTRVSMLGVCAGAVLFVFGWQHLRILAFPIAFLILMIPIPAIVFNQIAFPLQLLASRFGEVSLALFGVPVLREGNVIVLANTSLEVAEACSGIRSLVSLLTLAIVYGYFADGRAALRVALAAASIPIAIVANGVRVAGTGLAAHFVGPAAAEGFFHTFSGWLVFLVAFAMLFAVQRLLAWLLPVRSRARDTLARSAEVATCGPRLRSIGVAVRTPPWIRALVVSLCLVLGAVFIARASRSEAVPARQSLETFPLQVSDWTGQPAERFDERVLAQLRVDDYVSRPYASGDGRSAVGLYVGYYQTQRQGQTMHSPLNCLPGAGWEPAGKEALAIDVRDDGLPGAAAPSSRSIVVNRLVIQKGLDRQVVLYWYQSHGRVVASEYWGKIYTVVDAIRMNRTDAAMIRIIAPVAGSEAGAEAAAQRLAVRFAQAVFPLLGRYVPS